MKARLPGGDWTWPAIWLLPEDKRYGGWPISGEIDIVEAKGNRNLTNAQGLQVGSEHMSSTLHFGPAWNNNAYWAAHGEKNTAPGQGYDRDFHIFGMTWTPSEST